MTKPFYTQRFVTVLDKILIERIPDQQRICEDLERTLSIILHGLGSPYVVRSVNFQRYPTSIYVELADENDEEPDEDSLGVCMDAYDEAIKPLEALYGARIEVPSWYWSK